jgi:hypothetical protein
VAGGKKGAAGGVIGDARGVEVEAGVIGATCGMEGEAEVIMAMRGTGVKVKAVRGEGGRTSREGGRTVSLYNASDQTAWGRCLTTSLYNTSD